MTIWARAKKKWHPRYCGRTSTMSDGRVCRRTSRGTAGPTVNAKLTLLRGCTFSRVIDWARRGRSWSLMLTEAVAFVGGDCVLFGAVAGWAGCCVAVFALPV